MTHADDQDKDPAVKPQVIDLDATDVTASEAPHPQQPDEPSPSPTPRRQRGLWSVAALALIAGAVLGGWLYRDLLASYLPTDEMRAMSNRIGAIEVSNKALSEQVGTIGAAADAAAQKAAGLDGAMKDATGAASSAAATASALDQRIGKLERGLAAAQDDLGKLRAGLSTASTGSGTADPAALAAITQRIDALEKDVAALKAGGGSADNAALVTALRQALSDLQAKVAAGAPYRADLDRLLKIVPAAGNDFIASYADNGLANAQGLASELRTIAKDLPKPAAPAADSGYASQLWNAVTSVVTIRDVGEADWPALTETAAKLAADGKLQEAVATLDAAQAEMPETLAHWRSEAVARLKLEAAVADLARAVQLTLAAKGAGQ